MAVAATFTRYRVGRIWKVFFKLTLSGTYPTGGETLSFLAAVLPQGISRANPPLAVDINNAVMTNRFVYVPGTTRDNGKVMAGVAGVEVSAGAYPGGVSGDVISGHADFAA